VIHELKTLPSFFHAIRVGEKTFEIRKNDRNFEVGDRLQLKEWDGEGFTGEEVFATVLYLTDFQQKKGYVVMSIDLDQAEDTPETQATIQAILNHYGLD